MNYYNKLHRRKHQRKTADRAHVELSSDLLSNQQIDKTIQAWHSIVFKPTILLLSKGSLMTVIGSSEQIRKGKLLGQDALVVKQVTWNWHTFNSSYVFNKEKVQLSCIIGVPFGSVLQLNRQEKTLTKASLTESEMFEVCDLNAEMNNFEGDPTSDPEWKDNRHLLDDQSSQKLSMEDIEELKQSASNRDIIDNLVKNSTTFEGKSLFSQAKYIKKKKQKYTNHYRLLKPSVKLLTDMFFVQGPSKQTNLRLDTVAQMLTAVNVRSGGKYIVIDNYLGLLAAAVVDRIIGVNAHSIPSDKLGSCIQMFLEAGPVASWRSCVEALNLPKDVLEQVLFSCQIHQVYKDVLKKGALPETTATELKDDESQKGSLMIGNQSANQGNGAEDYYRQENDRPLKKIKPDEELTEEEVLKKRKLDERSKRKESRRIEERKSLDILSNCPCDGFLVLSKNTDPSSFVHVLLDLISPSSPFAIYNHVAEPLAQCMVHIKDRAVNLRLSESWLRRYQVLPGRTRPDMNMSTTGGFILTGTKVVD